MVSVFLKLVKGVGAATVVKAEDVVRFDDDSLTAKGTDDTFFEITVFLVADECYTRDLNVLFF